MTRSSREPGLPQQPTLHSEHPNCAVNDQDESAELVGHLVVRRRVSCPEARPTFILGLMLDSEFTEWQ